MNIFWLLRGVGPFLCEMVVVVDIFWLMVGGSGHILAGGGNILDGGEWWVLA